jgi:hypothetical protein
MASISRMTEDGKVKLVKEIDKDARDIYHIRITQCGASYAQEARIDCINLEAAEKLFELLSEKSDYLI